GAPRARRRDGGISPRAGPSRDPLRDHRGGHRHHDRRGPGRARRDEPAARVVGTGDRDGLTQTAVPSTFAPRPMAPGGSPAVLDPRTASPLPRPVDPSGEEGPLDERLYDR